LRILLTVALLATLPIQGAQAEDHIRKDGCPTVREGIAFYRNTTWKWQDKLHAIRYRTSYSDQWARGCGYLRWVARLWQDRSSNTKSVYRRQIRRLANLNSNPQSAICHVFGRYCREAIAVARCESRLSTGAANGQFLGLFQMGSSERELFGHGDTALEQARAAHRYFVASGSDWSPWSCRPYYS
jgi:hypothetical protein